MNIKRLFTISGSILLVFTFILVWFLFRPTILTRAASFTVCPAGPPTCGYSSIQSSVDAANDGDTIKVAGGTYTGINNKGGKPQMVYIDKSVTIRGGYTTSNWETSDPVANPTTLDAQKGGRVLFITGNVNVTIEGLRITGGDANGLGGSGSGEDAGGGVYAIYATATFKDNQIFSNTANSSQTGTGGGLFFGESSATLVGNTISDNYGNGVFILSYAAELVNNTIEANGRGVFLWEIDNATIIGNTISHNTNNGHCGALQSFGDSVTIKDNLITHNSSDWNGGICVGGNNAKIIGNTISYNSAVNVAGGGSFGGDAEFIGNIVTYNSAGDIGGGLYVVGDSTISGNSFYGNAALTGAALTLAEGNPILTNNIIVDNQANIGGSAIYIQDGVTNSHLIHNTIALNNGGEGNGISIFGASVDLTNNIIVDHNVGVFAHEGASASLESTFWGSGIWANDTDWAGDGTIHTSNNIWGNPGFVDNVSGDYHIGSDSDAIDQGIDAGVKYDIDFHPRPYQEPDIGADEYWPPGTLKFIYLPIVKR